METPYLYAVNNLVAFLTKVHMEGVMYSDCLELLQAGNTEDGVYTFFPGGTELNVVCDMTTYNGGWTAFQQRRIGKVDFYRGWGDYVCGFGDATTKCDYWLGLEWVHRLTQRPSELYIKLTAADGIFKHAKYSYFYIEGASTDYTIQYGTYSGTSGDSLTSPWSGKVPFSTYDNPHTEASCSYATVDKSCVATYHTAWWVRCCFKGQLNGEYLNTTATNKDYGVGTIWGTGFGGYSSLVHTTMMIRRQSP